MSNVQVCPNCDEPMRRVSHEYHPKQDVLASSFQCEQCRNASSVTEKRHKPIWYCLRHIKVSHLDIDMTNMKKSP